MKIFQNKFFIICLCVAVVVCAVPSTLAVMGYRSLSKNIVGTLTQPVRWCFSAIGNGFEGIGRYFQSVTAVHEQNEQLREENEALERQLADAELLEAENERLRSYLGMKNQYPSFQMEEGMIISYSAGSYKTSFTLNRGTLHGIAEGMPVITSAGLVGYVSSVGLNWSMVMTVIEADVSVGAYIPRSGAVGILCGDEVLREEGVCKITSLEAGSDVQVGDRVITSGIGSVYPAELAIGEVIAVEQDAYSRTLTATVRPYVDLAKLQYVMIVTGYVE